MSFVHDTNGYVPAIISAPWQQQLLRDSPQKEEKKELSGERGNHPRTRYGFLVVCKSWQHLRVA